MLNPTQFEIVDHSKFNPSTFNMFHQPIYRPSKGNVVKAWQNPTKKETLKDGYKPRLTAMMRPSYTGMGAVVELKVEFSAPKILLGNNFDELIDIDFGDLVRALSSKMLTMGVRTTPEGLSQALVSTVHYSKNVHLDDYARCSMVLQELAKLNIWKRLDVNSKDYRNNGHVLKWHANSYEICIYDKVLDLQKARTSNKRALENDADCQMDMFQDMKERQTQVLRLEVRLNTRRKIRSVLQQLDEADGVCFHDLFAKRLARKVLLHFWAELMGEFSMAAVLEADLSQPDKFIEAIMAEHPTMTPAKATSIVGITLLLKETGEKGLAVLLANKNPRTAYRLIKDCKAYQPRTTPRWTAIRQVRQKLDAFHPLRLKKETLIN